MTPLSTIDHKDISANALKVIRRLESHNFKAYLVGGGVRDLLLGGHPKDFDVSTDARPEQIREIFRNARIIGRRFRIVHIVFGREIIEVTTFRGHHPEAARDASKQQAAVSASGRLLRDNVYGSIEEDALRRDFTVNALYYNPGNGEILDFCGGLDDLKNRQLRLIGNPQTRYREDPVRILRAVRFHAKLQLQPDADVTEPIGELAPLLHDIPPARMFDEVLKLFMAGAAVATYDALQHYQLFGYLFPSCQRIVRQQDPTTELFIANMLRNTDTRIRQGKTINPAFLYGAFLWPATRQHTQALIKQGEPPVPAGQQAGTASIEHQLQYTSIPRRFSSIMREIWDLQHRLEQPQGRKPEQMLELQRFRAAYDFLLLRESAGEETGGMGRWWTTFQSAGDAERAALIGELLPKRKRKRRARAKQSRQSSQPKFSDQAP